MGHRLAFVHRAHAPRRGHGDLALGILVIFLAGWDAWTVLDTPTWPITYIVARSVIGGSAPLIYLLTALYAGAD
ncbi:MAG TPA: hypothetical protein VEO54_24680 [Thermoanaerobaculia bacterium]|nr:hypothetical protein [Thermoanaerobaculia bacterium]